jgi:hypothetical protein
MAPTTIIKRTDMPLQRVDDAALFWNEVFLNAALADSLKPFSQQEHGGPTRTSRAAAIIHIAIHDAVNGIDPYNHFYVDSSTGAPLPLNSLYQDAMGNTPTKGSPVGKTSAESAGAAAAHHALSQLYTDITQKTSFDNALANFRSLKGLDPTAEPDIMASEGYGIQVATNILNARAADGSQNANPPYNAPMAAGVWQPDSILAPPGPPLGVGWGKVRPFLINYTPAPPLTGPFPPSVPASSSPFFPPAPPPLNHPDYAFAFDEVFNKGRNNSPAPPLGRTDDETEIALFWSYDDALGTPIRLYNLHAFQILNQEPVVPTTIESFLHRHARLFALINLAMADAGIVCWDSKYYYNLWRPFQGIRLVDGANIRLLDAAGNPILDDGNPQTDHDATWLPLGRPRANVPNTTPNFPAYVSGHSSFGAASFGILGKFFTTDPFPFTLSSEEVSNTRDYADSAPGMTPEISSWAQVILENSDSRIYLGVHWRRDARRGKPAGQEIADAIWPNYLRPR